MILAIILFVTTLTTVLKLYLNYRQIVAIRLNYQQTPSAFATKISTCDHQKAANYTMAKIGLDNQSIILDVLIFVGFSLGGGLNLINSIIANHFQMSLSYEVLVMIAYTVVTGVIGLPFRLYSIFGIEQKFGFNKMTIKLFIVDSIKSMAISAVIGIPLLYLVFWLMAIMGNSWWMWVWGVLVIFNLVALIIYPTIIAPLFNKFTTLEDSELLDKITQLLNRCGFKVSGVFVMDGSKRSSHGNAYFTGLGKSKRIVFFDTLLKNLTHDEIQAVLAHELGHFKYKHIVKQIILSFTLTLLMLYIASLLIYNPQLFSALNISEINSANGLIILSFALNFVLFPLNPLFKYLSRKNEFEADSFAKKYTNAHDLISGLIKLYKDNASTLTPDDLYVKFYYSHPPAIARIANLEKSI